MTITLLLLLLSQLIINDFARERNKIFIFKEGYISPCDALDIDLSSL
jgi:hypothetical protein